MGKRSLKEWIVRMLTLCVGLTIAIREGGRTVGSGRVATIIE